MMSHLITVAVLLLALACYVVDLPGPGMVLFFLGAAIEIVLWLRAIQAPRRAPARLLARLAPRR